MYAMAFNDEIHLYFYVQFVPEFEKECFELWKAKGVEPYCGLSAQELFQMISTSLTPHKQMIFAVQRLRHLGINVSYLILTNIVGSIN